MIKKTIKYVDFNGTEREEDFYFHLSSPELTRIAAKHGLEHIQEVVQQYIQQNKFDTMLDLFEEIVLGAYGEKDPNGVSFIKSEEATRRFEYSEAYAVLFEELISNPEEMNKFFTGIGMKNNKNDLKPKFTIQE